MNVNKSVFVPLFALALLGACGQAKPLPAPPSAMRVPNAGERGNNSKFDLSVARTVGNGTWIPINRPYLQYTQRFWDTIGLCENADMPLQLLEVIAAFEEAHPELEVYGRQIEWQQNSKTTSSFCFGVYLFHRPQKDR